MATIFTFSAFETEKHLLAAQITGAAGHLELFRKTMLYHVAHAAVDNWRQAERKIEVGLKMFKILTFFQIFHLMGVHGDLGTDKLFDILSIICSDV